MVGEFPKLLSSSDCGRENLALRREVRQVRFGYCWLGSVLGSNPFPNNSV
jgi:hypothetical protein